ncbi:hypothetical protein JCM6882_003441 [Rhodosporidiobolus microsporus]
MAGPNHRRTKSPQLSSSPAAPPPPPAPRFPHITLSMLPWATMESALKKCMLNAGLWRVVTRQLQPEEYGQMLSEDMRHIYEQSLPVRSAMVGRVAEVVAEMFKDGGFNAWQTVFNVVLGRYTQSRASSTSTSSSTSSAPLSRAMQDWSDAWKGVTRIRSLTLTPDGRRAIFEGMRALEYIVEQEGKKEGGRLPRLKELDSFAKGCGAFEPRAEPPAAAAEEQVQHSLSHYSRRALSHMSARKRMLYGFS